MQSIRWFRPLTLTLVVLLGWGGSVSAFVVFVSDTGYVEYDIIIPSIDIEPGGMGKVKVAVDRSFEQESFTGCRFRVAYLPSSWVVFFNPSPNAVAVPYPDNMGVFDVQFTECQPVSQTDPIVLGELILLATESTTVHDHRIQLEGLSSDLPSWPLVRFCDSTELDVPGGQLVINPTVAVQGVSWSQIKSLYEP